MDSLLPASTYIEHVHLRVNDLQKVVGFYVDLLDLHVAGRFDRTVVLSALPVVGADVQARQLPFLIRLSEDADAIAGSPRSAGLFHVAFRFPNRAALAQTVGRLLDRGYPLQGASDHAVSEAIYLADPEGNGIELYCDRPRESWRWEGDEIYMTTAPLDLDDLLSQALTPRPLNIFREPDIGHIHLCVTNLDTAERFYAGVLGFRITTRSYPGALFFAAGSYHHHIGTNVWYSRGGVGAHPRAAGLVEFGIAVPEEGWEGVVRRVRDSRIPFEHAGGSAIRLTDLDNIGVKLSAFHVSGHSFPQL